jgi:hypothetical protein
LLLLEVGVVLLTIVRLEVVVEVVVVGIGHPQELLVVALLLKQN